MRSSTLKRHVVEYHVQTSTTRSKQERERASSARIFNFFLVVDIVSDITYSTPFMFV